MCVLVCMFFGGRKFVLGVLGCGGCLCFFVFCIGFFWGVGVFFVVFFQMVHWYLKTKVKITEICILLLLLFEVGH